MNERGIYTCYCRHLLNTTYNAKSVMLEVKSDWKQLWENDEVRISIKERKLNFVDLVYFIRLLIFIG